MQVCTSLQTDNHTSTPPLCFFTGWMDTLPAAQPTVSKHWRHIIACTHTHTNTRTHTFNGPLSWTIRVSRYQKGKTNLDFTEARDSEWQWHQLGHMQVCTLLQTDNHTSTPPLCFLLCFWRLTNSVKALKAQAQDCIYLNLVKFK